MECQSDLHSAQPPARAESVSCLICLCVCLSVPPIWFMAITQPNQVRLSWNFVCDLSRPNWSNPGTRPLTTGTAQPPDHTITGPHDAFTLGGLYAFERAEYWPYAAFLFYFSIQSLSETKKASPFFPFPSPYLAIHTSPTNINSLQNFFHLWHPCQKTQMLFLFLTQNSVSQSLCPPVCFGHALYKN